LAELAEIGEPLRWSEIISGWPDDVDLEPAPASAADPAGGVSPGSSAESDLPGGGGGGPGSGGPAPPGSAASGRPSGPTAEGWPDGSVLVESSVAAGQAGEARAAESPAPRMPAAGASDGWTSGYPPGSPWSSPPSSLPPVRLPDDDDPFPSLLGDLMDAEASRRPTPTVRPAFDGAGLAGNSSRPLPPPAWVLPEDSFDATEPNSGLTGPMPAAAWPSSYDGQGDGRVPEPNRDPYPDDGSPELTAAGAFGSGSADGHRFGLRAFDPGRRGVRALAAVAVVVIVLAAFLAWRARPRVDPVAPPAFGPTAAIDAGGGPTDVSAAAGRRAASSAPAEVVVAVGGKVHKPGLVHLPPGARVADALTAAGGADTGVDVAMLNLARKVVDGELILVGVTPPPGANTGPLAGGAAPVPGGPVNLNTATLADLDGLPGVGPVLAQRILNARDAQGGFTAVSDLRKVSGIGDARYEQLKDLVTV
jgi:competence protein ComEA